MMNCRPTDTQEENLVERIRETMERIREREKNLADPSDLYYKLAIQLKKFEKIREERGAGGKVFN